MREPAVSRPITADPDPAPEAALAAAHFPSLAAAVAQLTGDVGLLRNLQRPVHKVGDPTGGLPVPQIAEIRAAALAALGSHRERRAPPAPSPAAVREMMDFVAGTDIPERYVPFLLEELAIDGEHLHRGMPQIDAPAVRKQSFRVLIIGGGMSGILAAIELGKAGIPYLLVDKNAEFAGTWYENAYPGCRVDSPNYLYGYSSEPEQWPQHYSTRDVLFGYFKRCAEKYNLHRHTMLRTTVEQAVYDAAASRWRVRIREGNGRAEEFEVSAIISAVGQLNRPKLPDIQGRESFAGTAFHSSRWNVSCDLAGKRIAVIGSGASAFQFLPEIAPQAGRLFLFQRSAPWLAPTPDYHQDITPGEKWLLRHMPYYKTWYRFWLFWMLTDGIYASVTRDPGWRGEANAVGELNDKLRILLTDYISGQVGDDAELLRKVLPTYPPGGKRMLRDNGIWIAALRRENAEIVCEGIRSIVPDGILTEDGRKIAVDVIIYGTGFHASSFLSGMRIVGRGGLDLQRHWDGDARAYLGITIPGFPNLFCLYGPNTNIVVNGSIIFFSECAVRYILGCIKLLLEKNLSALECRKDVHDAFNENIDAANARMAWGAPQVTSWYKNSRGRVSQNWPLPLVDYWLATRAPDAADFILIAAR
jgi:4-hydroxyacetophenone monooxygenase